jgi:predicted nucleic acid-binding Zn finger protein
MVSIGIDPYPNGKVVLGVPHDKKVKEYIIIGGSRDSMFSLLFFPICGCSGFETEVASSIGKYPPVI